MTESILESITPFKYFDASLMADRNSTIYAHSQSGKVLTTLLIALGVVIVLAVGLGGGYYYYTTRSTAEAATQKPPQPIFVTIKPMTINLGKRGQVLYIGLSLAVPDQATADRLTSHMPAVRNRVLLALSDQDADDLTSSAGKRRVARQLRARLRAPYRSDGKPLKINKVLFTNFIVQ
jgi:flagellar FliL protein